MNNHLASSGPAVHSLRRLLVSVALGALLATGAIAADHARRDVVAPAGAVSASAPMLSNTLSASGFMGMVR